MNETQIDELLQFTMEQARQDLIKGKSVACTAVVVDSAGEYTVIAGDFNNETEKQAWYAKIKRSARERRALAVVTVAGGIRGIYTPEGQKKYQEFHESGRMLRVDEAVRLGLCKKVYLIVATLQTPLHTVLYYQDYQWVKGKVVFAETMRQDTASGAHVTGQMVDFFDDVSSTQ